MADQVNDKRLEGISDIRDETDRTGMRIVIEVKHDANPQVVLNRLFAQTQLQTSFAINSWRSSTTRSSRKSCPCAISSTSILPSRKSLSRAERSMTSKRRASASTCYRAY